MYMYIYTYIYTYIYIYIERERERYIYIYIYRREAPQLRVQSEGLVPSRCRIQAGQARHLRVRV